METENKAEYREKYERLKDELESFLKNDIIVAFSGGADSSLLLKTACLQAKKNAAKVYAVTVQTMLHPKEDLQIAEKVAEETGAIHKILTVDELKEAGIIDNPPNRCYLCKKSIFQKIKKLARERGISVILEGTNAEDMQVYRPGIQALKELAIISPLADCGFTKQEIRQLLREFGVSVAERPASPCLATRLPYGAQITHEKLQKIAEGEAFIRAKGFYNVRLRMHDELARIEVDKNEIPRMLSCGKEIIARLKELGFVYVTLDMEGFRSGSMDGKLWKQ